MSEPLRRRLRARALGGLTRISSALPPPLLARALAAATPLARRGRAWRRTLANLDLALGDERTVEERRAIARGVFRHAARQIAEWMRLRTEGRSAWIDRTVELDDSVDLLREELAAGRGCLIVTPHLGNWELLAARLSREGLEGAVIGRYRPRDSSSDWLVDMRRAYGVRTLAQDARPREVLEVLRSGRTIGMLPDLDVRRLDGVFVPFFGVAALTMTAPAALARAARLPLLPARCVAVDGGRYRLSVAEPLDLDPSLGRREAAVDLLARLNLRFEAFIRDDLEQWAWHQPRWRTRPEDLERKRAAERA